MRLLVHEHYQNAREGLDYRAGEIVEVSPALGTWLLADSPGTFSPYPPPDVAPEDPVLPPVDRAVRAPRKKG